MSKVYSFRLDENNPREAQAKEVIDTWVSRGHSLRNVLSDALIKFNNEDNSLGEISEIVHQLSILLEKFPDNQHHMEDAASKPLPRLFTDAVGQSVRPGIKVE